MLRALAARATRERYARRHAEGLLFLRVVRATSAAATMLHRDARSDRARESKRPGTCRQARFVASPKACCASRWPRPGCRWRTTGPGWRSSQGRPQPRDDRRPTIGGDHPGRAGARRARHSRHCRGGGTGRPHSADIAGPFFLVDPLDGTKGFIQGRPEFTINIGLIEGRRPLFGLLYAPALADFYVTLAADEAVDARLEPACRGAQSRRLPAEAFTQPVPDPHALRGTDQPVAPQLARPKASWRATT